MIEQLTGAGAALVFVLAYTILVQVMAACIVLLGQFIVLQWRSLRALLAEPPRPVPAAVEVGDQAAEPPQRYQIGGGLVKW